MGATGTEQTRIDCSVANLLSVSLPVILSMLSGTLMQVLDRAMLSHFSSHAMDGATFASQLLDLFLLPMLSFATVSEVFVGQLNGARQFKRTSTPVVQMALFLIGIWAMILPLVLWKQEFFFPEELRVDGGAYFRVGFFTLPFYIIFSSLSAFFMGTRRPAVIVPCMIVANTLNLVLDWLMIFGHGPFPAMGTQGAALASMIATVLSCVLMLRFFFSKSNASNYATRAIRLDLSLLKKNIALGAPYSLAEVVEMSVWFSVLWFLEDISPVELTVYNIAITLWIFFTFVIEGFQKGVMALASNCFGAQQLQGVKKLLRSMGWLTVWGAVFMSIPLIWLYKPVLSLLFHVQDPLLLSMGQPVLFWLWVSLVLVVFTSGGLVGILNAGGDTYFLTAVKILTMLLVVGLPVGVMHHLRILTAVGGWILSGLQLLVALVCLLWRYRSQRWIHTLVSSSASRSV